MEELYRRFVVEGDFPYFRLFVRGADQIFENIKKGLPCSSEPYTADYGLISPSALSLTTRREDYGKPLFDFGNRRIGYSSFLLLKTTARYLETTVLSDLFQEEQRLESHKAGRVSPLRWWDNPENREMAWRRAEEQTKGSVTVAALRGAIYSVTKAAGVPESNPFFPSFVVSVVRCFFPDDPEERRILDPSAGWGDRLLGTMAAGAEYLGFDPNAALKQGHDATIARFGNKRRHRVVVEPFEEANVEPGAFDMVLSSPPFFAYEHYSTCPPSPTFATGPRPRGGKNSMSPPWTRLGGRSRSEGFSAFTSATSPR
jgi:hypothetical protein